MITNVEQSKKEITLIRFDENQKHKIIIKGKKEIKQYHGNLTMGYKGKKLDMGYYIQQSRCGMVVYTVDDTPMTGERLHVQRKSSKSTPYMQPNKLYLSEYGKDKVKQYCREFLASYVLLYTKSNPKEEKLKIYEELGTPEEIEEKLKKLKKYEELKEKMLEV